MKLFLCLCLLLTLYFLKISGAPTINCAAVNALEFEEYILETSEENTCDDRLVCKFHCKDFVKHCKKTGYFDLTQRTNTNEDEETLYNLACNTRSFSTNSEESRIKIALRFNDLVVHYLNLETKQKHKMAEFRALMKKKRTDRYWSSKIIDWAAEKGLSEKMQEMFQALLRYKDGLRGFAKICSKLKLSKKQLKRRIKRYTDRQRNKAYTSTGVELLKDRSNAMVDMYVRYFIRKWDLSPEKEKIYALFNKLSADIEKRLIVQIKEKKVSYCQCLNFKRFFKKSTKKNLQIKYGFSEAFNLKNTKVLYVNWIKSYCQGKCKE
jgi:hypothetical protein